VQLESASVIVKGWPLIPTVPVRVEPVLLSPRVTVTAPAPTPDPPLLTVIQLLSEGVAVHAHPLGAVTAKLMVWPEYATTDEGATP
jgi:hypothetical protein